LDPLLRKEEMDSWEPDQLTFKLSSQSCTRKKKRNATTKDLKQRELNGIVQIQILTESDVAMKG
jgi:hypothetical protein